MMTLINLDLLIIVILGLGALALCERERRH